MRKDFKDWVKSPTYHMPCKSVWIDDNETYPYHQASNEWVIAYDAKFLPNTFSLWVCTSLL